MTPTPTITPSPTPTPSVTPTTNSDTQRNTDTFPESRTPSPTPQQFGTPPIITSANLSTIDSGTLIKTDPTITRNGETGEGRIYRNLAIDGRRSQWLFGSTSAFDGLAGVDDNGPHALNQLAAFKFLNLQLAGDPAIDTSNDGPTNLALIGVNGLSTFGNGASFTFAGIDRLLLATQNGSINLGAAFSFSGLQQLIIYARGIGSSLTLGSSIATSSSLELFSEGAMTIGSALSTNTFFALSGGNFVSTNSAITANDLSVHSEGQLTINGGSSERGNREPERDWQSQSR